MVQGLPGRDRRLKGIPPTRRSLLPIFSSPPHLPISTKTSKRKLPSLQHHHPRPHQTSLRPLSASRNVVLVFCPFGFLGWSGLTGWHSFVSLSLSSFFTISPQLASLLVLAFPPFPLLLLLSLFGLLLDATRPDSSTPQWIDPRSR